MARRRMHMNANMADREMIENPEHITCATTELNNQRETAIHISIESPRTVKPSNTYLFIKRFFDVVLSLLAIIALWPLMLIVALAIKIESKGPVIFRQARVGKDGKEFCMYKFRSMCVDAESKRKDLLDFNERGDLIFKIKKDPRITRVGKVIRKTSIDELPQLINIIKSDMSIVGPRPPLLNEVEKYTAYHMQRLSVKGGLTCYWQISGRSDLDFEGGISLDLK